jgi:hypothetical protein
MWRLESQPSDASVLFGGGGPPVPPMPVIATTSRPPLIGSGFTPRQPHRLSITKPPADFERGLLGAPTAAAAKVSLQRPPSRKLEEKANDTKDDVSDSGMEDKKDLSQQSEEQEVGSNKGSDCSEVERERLIASGVFPITHGESFLPPNAPPPTHTDAFPDTH